jgi:hypothetical protein
MAAATKMRLAVPSPHPTSIIYLRQLLFRDFLSLFSKMYALGVYMNACLCLNWNENEVGFGALCLYIDRMYKI